MSCKVCDSPDRAEIDRRFGDGYSSRSIARWTVDELTRPITHPTLTKHRKHAMPAEVTALEVRTNGEKPQLPSIRTSSAEFLEQVVDQGARIIEKNPDKVKIDHALRAAVALERKKEDGKGGMRLLILALTGNRPPVTIRGEYHEVEGA
jgi:hypothetical protein